MPFALSRCCGGAGARGSCNRGRVSASSRAASARRAKSGAQRPSARAAARRLDPSSSCYVCSRYTPLPPPPLHTAPQCGVLAVQATGVRRDGDCRVADLRRCRPRAGPSVRRPRGPSWPVW